MIISNRLKCSFSYIQVYGFREYISCYQYATLLGEKYYYYLPSFFSIEIPVITPAEYKLPIIGGICICMFNLYIKMKFEKNYYSYRELKQEERRGLEIKK